MLLIETFWGRREGRNIFRSLSYRCLTSLQGEVQVGIIFLILGGWFFNVDLSGCKLWEVDH